MGDLTAEDRRPFRPDKAAQKANLRVGLLFGGLAISLIALGLADESPRDTNEPETPLLPAPPSDTPPAARDPLSLGGPLSNERSFRIPEDRSGQFQTPCTFNGIELRCCIDTGASDIVLDRPAARRVGIDIDGLRFDGRSHTANGIVRIANALVATLRVGPFELHDVTIEVNDTDLDVQLLGMSFLHQYKMTVSAGALTLRE